MKNVGQIIFGLFVTTILLTSCDGEAGLEGVVIDKNTGERIENVQITMSSNYETIETETDNNGYFYAIDFYTCGGIVNKCDDSFTAILEKEGYETLQLNENYISDSETEYLDETKKDTVTFKLTPIDE